MATKNTLPPFESPMRNLLVLTLLLLAHSATAQNLSANLIPSGRAIDWTQVGIPGGIPVRTTICANINAATFNNGSSDATTAIQAALDSCPANQVVQLSTGTFRINSFLRIPSFVTLRGQGPQQTVLSVYGSGLGAILFGPGDDPAWNSQSVSVSGGGSVGSTTITVSNASQFAVGKFFTINQLNDSHVTKTGEGGQSCTWCDIAWNGDRLEGQTVEITGVNGTSITFTPPLYRTYTNSPLATPWSAGAKSAGLEDLQVYANNSGYVAMEHMARTAFCWIKGVMNNFTDGDHVRILASYRNEVRDSYFSNAFVRTPGSTDADIFIATKSSACLVENNILERNHSSVLFNWGASGNVLAYNFSFGAFGSTVENFMTSDIVMHGAHPSFNLIEGNISTNFNADSTWGSSSHNTLFRNWWRGTTQIAQPLNGRGTIDWPNAWWAVQAVRAVQLCFAQRFFNLVGNVVGSSDMAALRIYNGSNSMPIKSMVVAPTYRSYDSESYGYSFGYSGAADSGSAPENSSLPYSTALIHGDYEYSRNSVAWDPSTANRTLPPSLFRTQRPSWFGSTPWPPIGPDVSGGNSRSRGYASDIPAKRCYDTSPRNPDGTIRFDPKTCYQVSVAPAAPTNLRLQ